jgi:hypothetical protein
VRLWRSLAISGFALTAPRQGWALARQYTDANEPGSLLLYYGAGNWGVVQRQSWALSARAPFAKSVTPARQSKMRTSAHRLSSEPGCCRRLNLVVPLR